MSDREDYPMSEKGRKKRDKAKKSSGISKWMIVAIIFILISLGLLIALIVILVKPSSQVTSINKAHSIASPSVQRKDRAKRANDIYSGLTDGEVQEVIKFLMDNSSLDLVPTSEANLSSNYIFTVEHHLPSKADMLDWLDGTGPNPPVRRARAILYLGETNKVKEYYVWPIPNPTKMEEAFTNRPQGKQLTWKSRPLCNTVEMPLVSNDTMNELKKLGEDLLKKIGGDCQKSIDKCLFFNVATRAALNSDDRYVITWFFALDDRIEDYYMYPVPLYIILSIKNGETNYQAQKVYYNKREYDSMEALKTALENDPSLIYKVPDASPNIGLYGSPRYLKDGDTIDQSRGPPIQFYPNGRRFTVEGQYVQWLKWSFNIHTRTVAGMQLFDVRFGDERIAYELSMQDIVVLYSSPAPENYFKNYFDNGWATGTYNMPLIRNVDCPPGAQYLDATVYAPSSDKTGTRKDAICIFEQRNSIPLRRHYSTDFLTWGYRFAFSMPDSVLIVRQALTIWNYDYIFDYEFHQNGVVEIKVSSTGYIAVSAALNPDDISHGFIVNPDWNAGANLHQHLFNFKLDVDVAGTVNRFKTINFKSESVDTPFANAGQWSQMIMNEALIQSEQDGLVRYDFSQPKYYVLYNFFKNLRPDADNPQPRGYRVLANGFSKVVLPEDSPLLKGAASWSKYQIAATKHKDNERATSSHFTQGDPYDAAVNFDRFVEDDESLVDEDIVLWVTVGLHHPPTNEDLPVTTTPGKTLNVILAPFNYFSREPSIHSRDAAVMWNKDFFDFDDDFLVSNYTCPSDVYNPLVN